VTKARRLSVIGKQLRNIIDGYQVAVISRGSEHFPFVIGHLGLLLRVGSCDLVDRSSISAVATLHETHPKLDRQWQMKNAK
jgi:hypothetical protein